MAWPDYANPSTDTPARTLLIFVRNRATTLMVQDPAWAAVRDHAIACLGDGTHGAHDGRPLLLKYQDVKDAHAEISKALPVLLTVQNEMTHDSGGGAAMASPPKPGAPPPQPGTGTAHK